MADKYNEDFFAESRMSFGDHLEELRKHLWKALIGFAGGLLLSFFIGPYVVDLIKAPVESALVKHYYEYHKKHAEEQNQLVQAFKKELEKQRAEENQPEDDSAWHSLLGYLGMNKTADKEVLKLNEPRDIKVSMSAAELDKQFRQLYGPLFEEGGPLAKSTPPKTDAALPLVAKVHPLDVIDQFQRQIAIGATRYRLSTLSAAEMFLVFFKVCIITGFVISSPWVIYQIWQFVAAGLYPHERQYVYYSLFPSIFLFLAGVVLCEVYIIPVALNALLSFNLMMNVEPDFRLNEWLGFAILMPVVTGLFFQTPLVMLFLGKIGVFTAEDFSKKRRYAIFGLLILAAIVSPAVDIPSLMLMWVPMVALYEIGILCVKWFCKPPTDLDESEEVPYQPETAGTSGGSSADGYRES